MLRQFFADKGEDLLIQTGTIVMDTILLAIWLSIEYLFEHFVVPRLPVDTAVFRFAFLLCRFLFAIATIVPVTINIMTDVQVIWARSRERVRLLKNPLNPGTPPDPLGQLNEVNALKPGLQLGVREEQ